MIINNIYIHNFEHSGWHLSLLKLQNKNKIEIK